MNQRLLFSLATVLVALPLVGCFKKSQKETQKEIKTEKVAEIVSVESEKPSTDKGSKASLNLKPVAYQGEREEDPKIVWKDTKSSSSAEKSSRNKAAYRKIPAGDIEVELLD